MKTMICYERNEIMSTDKKKVVAGRVTLKGVRLSFADIWRPKTLKREDGTESDPKYSANFLIPKEGDLMGTYQGKSMPIMKALKTAKIDAIAKKLGADKAAELKIRANNYAVKDGDEENYDGYAGQWFVSSNNSRKPVLKGRDKRDLTEADGILYSGCYVNAIVTLWYQAAGTKNGNSVPHAVYASLEAIQFVKDGDPFGAPGVDDDDFEDLTDGDDDIGDEDSGDDDDDML